MSALDEPSPDEWTAASWRASHPEDEAYEGRWFGSRHRADYPEQPSAQEALERAASEHPDNNPKTRVGALKAPLHLVPPSAEIYLAEALADGARKYGPYNWREERISTSVYIGAIKRHMGDFLDGEDNAEDSGVHHLAHVMACCALMLDAASIGMLNDDRPAKGAAPRLLEEYRSKREELS